jgi:hypothetical protein
MNRTFFLIDRIKMEQYGLRPDSGLDEVASVLQSGAVIPSIDKKSIFLPIDPEDAGIVIGWDIDDDTPMGASYYNHMRNHPAVHYLMKNGQSIDADPLLAVKSSNDRVELIKCKVEPMLDEIQPDGKRISDYNYDDFIGYVKRETNYFGETTSPVIALTLGSRFFGKTDSELSELGIPLGNYSFFQTKNGLMMDAFDYLAREFPGKLAIETHLDFLTGLNKKFNSSMFGRLEVNKPGAVKERLKGVVSAITKIGGGSPALKA